MTGATAATRVVVDAVVIALVVVMVVVLIWRLKIAVPATQILNQYNASVLTVVLLSQD